MEYTIRIIDEIQDGLMAYCKFLSANDTGDTGAHQAGIYIAKNSFHILFDEPGEKGSNKDRFVSIRWQGELTTESRFIYYGNRTRDEYRITRFGRGFPFLNPEHTGDLFILIKMTQDDYYAYLLQTEEEIEYFLNSFGMTPAETGRIFTEDAQVISEKVDSAIERYISSLKTDFPSSFDMSATARNIFHDACNSKQNMIIDPDGHLISWIDMEYLLFRSIEVARYGEKIQKGFTSVEDFIETANKVLNRRKSRAGKSLEHHLSAIFVENGLPFTAQARTEGNRRPDFIFPGEFAYHNPLFPIDRLIFLGAKTTCKDRWRQVINEAEKIKDKHLFTLQQGISVQQLTEMEEEGITLVVPKKYLDTYPKEKRQKIWTLRKFISYTKEKISV